MKKVLFSLVVASLHVMSCSAAVDILPILYSRDIRPDEYFEQVIHSLSPLEGTFETSMRLEVKYNKDSQWKSEKHCEENVMRYGELDLRRTTSCEIVDEDMFPETVYKTAFEKRDIRGTSYIQYKDPTNPIQANSNKNIILNTGGLIGNQWYRLDESVPREFGRIYAEKMGNWNTFGVSYDEVMPYIYNSQMGAWKKIEDTQDKQRWEVASILSNDQVWTLDSPLFNAIGNDADSSFMGDLVQLVHNYPYWVGTIEIDKHTSVMKVDLHTQLYQGENIVGAPEDTVHMQLSATVAPDELSIELTNEGFEGARPSRSTYHVRNGSSSLSVQVYIDSLKDAQPSFSLTKERKMVVKDVPTILPPTNAVHLGDYMDDGQFYLCARMAFNDVCGHWSEKNLGHASLADYIGIGEYALAKLPLNKLQPDQAITRAEFAKLIRNSKLDIVYTFYALGKKYIRDPLADLTDIDRNADYIDAVDFLYRLEITKPDPKELFKPKGTLTRAEMVTFLSRFLEKIYPNSTVATNSLPYGDMSGAEWYASHVARMLKIGVLDSTQTRFRAADPVTRAEAITMIERVRTYKDTLLLY